MINKIPIAIKLGNVGLNINAWEEERKKLSLYENDHLEDKVISEPYVYTEKMRFQENNTDYVARLKTKALFELVGKEVEHYLNHVPLVEYDICIYCSRDRNFYNDKQNSQLAEK